MARPMAALTAIACMGAAVAGCQSASGSVSAVRVGGEELYVGAGSVVRRPFHELNMMQDQIPPVLLRAEAHPYDRTGLNSCDAVLDRVAELDLALGPDVDTPKEARRSRSARGAHFAAQAAMDAAGSAADHFIPVRGVIEEVSGAKRYQRQAAHATLAGDTRRAFLKAVGMSHGCRWPAAPVSFTPATDVDPAADWNALPSRPALAPVSIPVDAKLVIPPIRRR